MLDKFFADIKLKYDLLPESYRKVAAYIAENYKEIPFLPVTRLAKLIGVSDSTVVKFCISFGFSGYTDFKKQISSYMQSEMTTYATLETNSAALNETANILDQVCHCEQNNIAKTLEHHINRANFEPLLELIQNASNVYILGFRSSAILAEYMALYLAQQKINASAVIPGIGAYVDKLCQMNDKDLLIAINFSRYSTEVVKAIEVAVNKGIPCVLITDALNNPIYPKVKLVFYCEMRSFYYAASSVGALALINTICTALSLRNKDAIKDYLRNLEELFEEFKTFYI